MVQQMISERLPKRDRELKRISAEKERKRKLEEIGVQVTSTRAFWHANNQEGLYQPKIRGKVKNVSSKAIQRLAITASFYNKNTKEQFGSDLQYVIGLSDVPLEPGFTKVFFLESSIGHTFPPITFASVFPPLTADLYVAVNDRTKIKVETLNIERELGR